MSLYIVKPFPNSDAVGRGRRVLRGAGSFRGGRGWDVGQRGMGDLRVFGRKDWGATSRGTWLGKGKGQSCGNEGGRRWVGGERCRTKRVRSGERLTREADALKNVTWSGSAHRQHTRLSSEIGSAARPTRFRGCHMPSSHFDFFFSLHSEFVIYTCRYLWASWLRL